MMPLTLSWIQLAICLLATAGVVWMSRRSWLVSLSNWRRWVITGLRVVLVLLLLLAIFEVKWKRHSGQLAVLFVLDESESVSDESSRWARNYLKAAAAEMTARDRAGLLIFGEQTYVEIAPTTRDIFEMQLERIGTQPGANYTDIGRAIRLALAVFPEGAQRRIVLLTDGEENLGSARDEALVASAGQVPIEIIPLQRAAAGEVLLERLIVPARVREDSTFEVRLLVNSSDSGPAQVRLFENGYYLGKKDIDLQPGKNVFSFPRKMDKPGFHTFEARIEALGDSRAENNVARAFTVVQGPPRVLYLVNPDDPGLSSVPRRLEREGVLVEMMSCTQAPSLLSEMQNYDSIVLDNVAATQFTESQMRAMERYVHDLGGGLVMIGGRNSFGPGGYHKTPVEEALPVEMTIKNKRHFPSFAQVIVVDKSGSMGMEAPSGKQKIELAAEGAMMAVELLNDQDYIGVIATDTQPKWVSPMRQASDRHAIIHDIGTLRAGGGGIYVYSGLREAMNHLIPINAMVKHIILFADAQDSEQQENCDKLVKEMLDRNITLTSVALGGPRDPDIPFLQSVAEMTGGRLHVTEDADQVPRIFTKETILAQRAYLVEEAFTPILLSTGSMLRGVDLDAVPQLLGYVGTTAKPRAEQLLVSHRTDPVLASWRYGLGKTVAFTSDDRSRWAQNWIGWDQFGKLWTQIIRWTLRNENATHLQTTLEVERGEGVLTVDALDDEGKFLNFLQLRSTVISPSMERIELNPRQIAPGRYEARFEAKELGTYLASVVDDTAGSAEQGARDTTGVSLSYPVEFKPGGRGPSLIKQIAEMTRGQVLEQEEELRGIFAHNLEERPAVVPIWEGLIWWVVLLLPLDIALRRLTISSDQVQSIRQRLRKLISWMPRTATGMPDATLEQLKEVKAGVRSTVAAKSETEDSEETIRLQKQLQQALQRDRAETSALQSDLMGRSDSSSPSPVKQPADEDSSTSPYTRRLLDAKRRARKGDPRVPPSNDD